MTKRPALLDPGGGSPLFLEVCNVSYMEVRSIMRRKDRVWESASGTTQSPGTTEGQTVSRLQSWPPAPAPLQLRLLKRPQGEWGVQARDRRSKGT